MDTESVKGKKNVALVCPLMGPTPGPRSGPHGLAGRGAGDKENLLFWSVCSTIFGGAISSGGDLD